jgi:predicted metal-binding membrane protein
MTEPGTGSLESVLRRDRLVVFAGLLAIVALAWTWLLAGAGTGASLLGMPGMAEMAMRPAVWTPGYAVLMFLMWWIMMAAMMLPSATPMLLLYARINRGERTGGRPYVPTGIFAAAYLVAWGGFSLFATLLQWGLENAGFLSPMMATTSDLLGAAILIAAGLWQLTPIKTICLRHCRSPLGFLSQSWRRGRWGAFVMGLEHGSYCLGCCWFLMALLFFVGIMNLLWIAGLAVVVLLEKTLPLGQWFARAAGMAGIVWGMLLLAGA